MGLKCSVLGHKYGETTVEREREEQGSEVVITIQERETCDRCGNTRIVSENKEVTAIETPSDIAGDVVDDADESAADTDESEGGTEAAEPADAEGDDSTILDDAAEDSAGDADADDDAEFDEPVDPSADDAMIIDDAEDTESGDAELDEPTTSVDVPDAEGDEPATEADPEEDDAMIIDDAEDETPDIDRDPGEWPDEPGEDDEEWAPETTATEADDGPAVEPASGPAVTVPEGQFHCPECGFTTDVESSSLREGDFCPECHKGALVTEAED